MNDITQLIQIGADLASAKVASCRVDAFGNGEFDIIANGRAYIFAADSECNISLWLCDDATINEDEINNAVDWSEFNNGKLYDAIHQEWINAASGPFYDFWLQEYAEESNVA